MNAILLDTHAWAWSMTDDPRLSRKAQGLIETAVNLLVSPISFHEIEQKIRIGRWADMAPYSGQLTELPAGQRGQVASLTAETCSLAAVLDWDHRDPFDRILAATAMALGVPVVSADTVFDGLGAEPRWIARFW